MPRNNLPHSLISFIGRQREIDEIDNLVNNQRLVTLTGAGGIGKTQLELQIGLRLLETFPDGIWLVELAPISDPILVPQTITFALGLWESPSRSILEQLIEYLRDKNCLLIFDNCEHLIDVVAKLLETILRSCSKVKILASSREALGIPGEIVFLVPPLSFPDVEPAISFEEWEAYDALRLFVARSRAVLPSFQLTSANLTWAVRICQRLDGIPLAIELAAARINLLTVEQIATRLDNCFSLLTVGNRTTLERQQTLRASIEWSWELLSNSEQVLLQRLSIFDGGMSLDAVETICGEDGLEPGKILTLLTQLVNKSMLNSRRQQGQETRYRLLETIRQYATEELVESGEREKYLDRHLAYFCQFGEQAERALVGPDQVAWLEQMEIELDNIRTALSWANENKPEAGLRLITTTWRFWVQSYVREGEAWLSKLLARSITLKPKLKAKSLWVQGVLEIDLLNITHSQELIEKSLVLFRELEDKQGIANCLFWLPAPQNEHKKGQKLLFESLNLFRMLGDKLGAAEVLCYLGYFEGVHNNYKKAMVYLKESELLFRELGHLAGVADVLNFSARLAIWQGDYSFVRPILEESLSIHESLGLRGIIRDLTCLGNLYFRLGDYEHAHGYFEKSLSLCQQTGERSQSYWALVNIGYVFLRMGELDKAQEIFVKSQQKFMRVGANSGVIYASEGLAHLALSQGQAEKAARMFGWADATRNVNQDPRHPVEQKDVDQDIATIIERIGEEAFSIASDEGKSMIMEEVIAFSMAEEKF